MAITFDDTEKLVIFGVGTTTVSLNEVWSRYKDHLLAGNAGNSVALDTLGGDSISQGIIIPLYLFQKNGWKFRPQESNHTLTITGGILVGENDSDPFVSTLGAFTVKIVYSQPAQALGYSTNGGGAATPSQIAAAVRSEISAELAKILTIPSDVLLAATTAPIHSDTRKVNNQVISGSGTANDPWGA